IPPSQIVLRRDITYNDNLVLSKEAEEALLWRDIQNDLVQQILRRLAAAKLKATDES
ncbi:LPS assembly lipoprotein LptE, partial [Hydrogenophaga sp.]|uniref:LPS-assembly lipoprotein LptE n=1 Tax=Hydrogenophaga sp. TaxID=1904254 RepID=UPI0039FCFD6C